MAHMIYVSLEEGKHDGHLLGGTSNMTPILKQTRLRPMFLGRQVKETPVSSDSSF